MLKATNQHNHKNFHITYINAKEKVNGVLKGQFFGPLITSGTSTMIAFSAPFIIQHFLIPSPCCPEYLLFT